MRVRVDGSESEMELSKAHADADAGAIVEVLDGLGRWRSIDRIFPRLVTRGSAIGI